MIIALAWLASMIAAYFTGRADMSLEMRERRIMKRIDRLIASVRER